MTRLLELDGYRGAAGGAPLEDRILQQAHRALEQAEDVTELQARGWAELRERERLLRERQHDVNSATAILTIGCGAMVVAIAAGGWWCAAAELAVIAYLIAQRQRGRF